MKHFEIVSFEKHGVKVNVEINYDLGKVSLVERKCGSTKYTDKNWLFAGREIEYMNGWLHIIDAMKHAVTEATKLLEEDIKEKANRFETGLIFVEYHLRKESEGVKKPAKAGKPAKKPTKKK